jgi:hypothetical protein
MEDKVKMLLVRALLYSQDHVHTHESTALFFLELYALLKMSINQHENFNELSKVYDENFFDQ